MATIRYYTGKDSNNNPIGTNLKDIVGPLHTTAPTNLTGAALGGGVGTLKRRPLAQWVPTQNNSVSCSTTVQNIAGSCSLGGSTPERENYFSTDTNGIGIKVQGGSFILFIKGNVGFSSAAQAYLYIRTGHDNGALAEYGPLTGFVQAVSPHSVDRGLQSSYTVTVPGKTTSSVAVLGYKPAGKTTAAVTGRISGGSRMEICPATRINYGEKTSLV